MKPDARDEDFAKNACLEKADAMTMSTSFSPTPSALRIPGLSRARAALGTALALNAAAQPALEAPFVRIANGTLATETAMSGGAAWGDYDNDGWLDLFATVFDPVNNTAKGIKNRLYRNQGDGSFVRINESWWLSSAPSWPSRPRVRTPLTCRSPAHASSATVWKHPQI